MASLQEYTSLCACSNPVIIQDSFHGLEQSYCEICGNVASSNNMRVIPDSHVRVRGERPSVGRFLRKFLALLDNICGVQGLSYDMREEVALRGEEIYKVVRWQKDKERYAVACIADVLQRKGIECDFRDLCKKYKIPYTSLYAAYRHINGKIEEREERGILGDIYDIAWKCDEFMMNKHDHPSKLTEISDLASNIFKLLEVELSYNSHRLMYLASALCILASKHFFPKGLTNGDVANMMSINLSKLSTMVARVSRMLVSLAERMPWKPAHVNATNIYVFLADIIEYCSPLEDRNNESSDEEKLGNSVKERKIKQAVTRIENRTQKVNLNPVKSENRGKAKKGVLREVEKRFDKANGRRPISSFQENSVSSKKRKKNVDGCNEASTTEIPLRIKEEKPSVIESPVTKFEKIKGTIGDSWRNNMADDWSKDGTADSTSVLDSEDVLIEDLLLKGCDAGEILNKNYSELCKSYHDNYDKGEENLSDDDDISDSDIESYCLTPEEVLVKARMFKKYCV